jgi:acetolactate decarboxylase
MKPTLAIAFVALFAAAPAQAQDRDTLYQVSTLGALQQGLYQPALSIKDLEKHGDFGLGTYEGLDGEMVVTGATVFQVPFSGRARVAKPGQQTPFAAVTFFDADQRFRISREVDLAALGSAIDRRLPSTNYFYAVKVTGTFTSLQTRSVRKQDKPYQPLSAAIAGQRTFDLSSITGTLVGIRSPEFVGTMNVPGYHWHFIAKDGKTGGHVLSLSASGLKVAADETRHWHVEMPDTKAFQRADLT